MAQQPGEVLVLTFLPALDAEELRARVGRRQLLQSEIDVDQAMRSDALADEGKRSRIDAEVRVDALAERRDPRRTLVGHLVQTGHERPQVVQESALVGGLIHGPHPNDGLTQSWLAVCGVIT